jgi:hypothetical protein
MPTRGLSKVPGLQQGQSRLPLAALTACFAIGIAVGAFWISQRSRMHKPSAPPPGIVLTEQTRNVLAQVNSPLTLRFYALIDPPNLPAGWTEFTQRVSALLGAYQEQTASNITVTRYDTISEAAANQASADGVKPFNQDKGAACYCGIAVVQGGRSETLAHLEPLWEPALEFDLTRAIARVITPPSAPPVSSETASNQIVASEQVLQTLTNVSTVSLEQGSQILRDAALADFKAAVAVGAAQVKEAEDKLQQVQNGSDAEKQAALKRLQEARAEQTQKLKDIAARLQNELEALQRMKSTNAPGGAQ